MKIHIEDTTKTEDIKSKFSQYYPYLKLEFFRKSHDEGEASTKGDIFKENEEIGNIRTKHNTGDFEFTPDNTVNELEQGFEEKFGIHVQVFRKSHNLWLETTATDSWTLREQNETGKEMDS